MSKINTIFATTRLIIRELKASDELAFFDLMGNPKVMNPIPLPSMTKAESDLHLQLLMEESEKNNGKKVWSIDTKAGDSFIGLCAMIKNDEGEDELAYRLREKFWRNGFGTEVTRGIIDYSFGQLKLELITADVNIENKNSVKILDKFLSRVKEFENKTDHCINRRYRVTRSQWLNRAE